MLHLAEAIRQHGPCWAWSLFGLEPLCGRLKRWMTQTSHPEATMIKSRKAFMTCCVANLDRVTELHNIDDNPINAAGAAGAVPFLYLLETFNRQTYDHELKLPKDMRKQSQRCCQLTDLSR